MQTARPPQQPDRLKSWASSLAKALLVLCLCTGIAGADMLDTDGMEPWELCGLCHGLQGVSPVPRFPHLAHQSTAYIEKQFRDFRDGLRHNDGGQMGTVTMEIEPEALPKIAAYFAKQPPPPPVLEEGPRFAQGRDLFLLGRAGLRACIDCHGPLASAADVPWLEAQHRDYLLKQLSDFASGARSNDPGGVMQALAESLEPAEREALADYLAATERPNGDFE
ncbi:c-type cytochrome [Chelativorans alearense]|uniref:c-type cytochrome n=1 Tax=Chelativorans alearense TaxID=2681495 RepID=UPI001FE9992D|nr:cytochrome C [Chelativorans alearense]